MTAREMAIEKAVSMKGQRDQIVDLYNTYTPRARSYKVKYDDMLCATYVSAIFIALGWTDIVPPECGARQLYQNMAALGRGVQDPKRVPEPGDLIFFGDSKYVTGIKHVGIVTEVTNGGKRIYYYDIQSKAGRHTCPVGYSYIWGYGIPDYESKDTYSAQPKLPKEEPTVTVGNKTESKPTFKAGDLVRVKPGARWYSGSTIKATVFSDTWYLIQVKGDRAVLGMNYAETRNIQSPIHTDNIEHVYPQEETPVEEIKMEVKIALSATVLESTAEKLKSMASQSGKSVGEIIDELTAKGAM